MPIMDGKEAMRQVINIMKWGNIDGKPNKSLHSSVSPGACEAKNLSTKIVVLTSFTNQSIIDECLALGAKAVYAKPLTSDNLDEIMRLHFHSID